MKPDEKEAEFDAMAPKPNAPAVINPEQAEAEASPRCGCDICRAKEVEHIG